LRPDGAHVSVNEVGGCITLLRSPRDRDARQGKLLAVFNCTAAAQPVALPDEHGEWMLRLTTDATGYGGDGRLTLRAEREAWSVGRGALGVERGPLGVERGALGVAADSPRRLLDVASAQTVSIPPWTAALFSLAASGV
jgi:hypothetical protein